MFIINVYRIRYETKERICIAIASVPSDNDGAENVYH